MGFNKNWIVVSAVMLATDYSGPKQQNIYCFDRTNFYANGTTRTDFAITTLSNNFWICPAVTLDPNQTNLYFVQTWSDHYTNFFGNVQGLLRMHSISGTPSSPTFNSSTTFPATTPWASKEDDDPNPNFLPQAGYAQEIDVGTDVIENVVYRNGFLWAAHTILLPADNPTRSSIQWWQIPIDGQQPTVGRLDDSGGINFYAYPSIAVNKNNDVLIGVSIFSTNSYASAGYAFRGGSDNPSTLRSPIEVYGTGQDWYYFPRGVRNRWGDYSTAVVDPVNDSDFWTLQEYAKIHDSTQSDSLSGRQGVKWAQVVVQKPGNDNFADAFLLSGGSGTTNGSLFRASAEVGEPGHAGADPYRSIWYKWTALAGGDVTFDTIASFYGIDTVLSVYVGTNVNSLTLVAENDNIDRLVTSRVKFKATNGTTYRIVLDGKSGIIEKTDAVKLSWNQPLSPTFITEPTDSVDVLVGQLFVLTSLAIGTPDPVYQWRLNSNIISGATFGSFTNSSAQSTNEGYYDVIASNSVSTAISLRTYVKVYPAPTATFTNFVSYTNRVEYLVNGINGYSYTVQGTSDFITWTNLQSGVADFVFTNYFSTNNQVLFFRTYY